MIRRRSQGVLALMLLALLALSCATSQQLTRRSEKLLMQGDARRAYDAAVDALEKDGHNEPARAALGRAGAALYADSRARFDALIPDDTLGAARLALDVERLLADLARWRASLPEDPEFAAERQRAKDAAADGLIQAADDSLHARRPRAAYRLLEQAVPFAPKRRDLDTRLTRAFDLAVDRVAVLPLDDQTGQPALSREVADRLAGALRARIAARKLEFTRLVEPAKVYGRMTVAQLDELSRDGAIALGREVGATVVVYGRIRDAGSDTYTTHYREPIWHRVVTRGAAGEQVERWEQVPFETVVRERVFHLRWDLRLLSTDDENVLDERSEPREVRARTVWTSFRPEDDPANYALVAPEERRSGSERVARVEKEWSAAAGKWTVPKLLERAKASNVSARSTYRHEYRGEFEHRDPGMPVFLGDLPGNDDLAWLALRDIDGAFLEMIEALDRR